MADEADLVAELEAPLPARLPAGTATAVFCYGSYLHRRRRVKRVEMLVAGRAHRPTAQGLARPDLGPGRAGFWGILPIGPQSAPGTVQLSLAAQLEGGESEETALGEIEIASTPAARQRAPSGHGGAAIAICLATFDPDEALWRRQLDSLRAQSEEDWICLISDDCSRSERYRMIEESIAGDSRFVISRSEERLGFYRNFERALGMVPAGIDLVALCDQDDHWDPDKLSTLRGAIDDADLVYCDARLVDPSGNLLAETMWKDRRNNHEDLASLLVTNTITGAASLFRRRVLERALPFPEAPGWQFHDHWLGLVALASGRIAYLDRPLYDYTQHRGAVLRGLIAGHGDDSPIETPRPGRLPSRASLRAAFERWRSRYFYGYVPVRLRAEVLRARCDRVTAPKERALDRLIAAEQGPRGLAWLLARRLRLLLGRSETNGMEGLLATGIAWSQLVRLGGRIGQGRRPACGAAMPGFDPSTLETKRWRRRGRR